MKAVVFAYHNVGVRCLKVLLARGVDIALVVSHEDNPQETIWFESVAALCREYNILVVNPINPDNPELLAKMTALKPDFIFSFYYRHMLPVSLLALAKRGAYNMHGSLLPKYRGRVPINWAVLHGETETGATLHEMTVKPDAGNIVAQTSVPILPDDTAHDVFAKVVVAAEQTLWRALPAMLNGIMPALPNNLSEGSYFGGRKPKDGKINWYHKAQAVYNLYRAVAPPYPGAWTLLGDITLVIENARLADNPMPNLPIGLVLADNCIFGVCGDGHALLIKHLTANGKTVTAQTIQAMLQKNLAQTSN
ncbi:MAG: formyltransferase [Glaciimonas sp.]|nr:formyltransferase [Glaciimonas sp.]